MGYEGNIFCFRYSTCGVPFLPKHFACPLACSTSATVQCQRPLGRMSPVASWDQTSLWVFVVVLEVFHGFQLVGNIELPFVSSMLGILFLLEEDPDEQKVVSAGKVRFSFTLVG